MNRIIETVRAYSLVLLLVSLPAVAEEPVSENDYGRAHIGGMRG